MADFDTIKYIVFFAVVKDCIIIAFKVICENYAKTHHPLLLAATRLKKQTGRMIRIIID